MAARGPPLQSMPFPGSGFYPDSHPFRGIIGMFDSIHPEFRELRNR